MKKTNKKPYLSIIIPAYNEEERLPKTLIEINNQIRDADFSYEIVVVDNNSKDSTREVAEKMKNKINNLLVLECKTQGKGAAVKYGMLNSNGDIKLFTDADNSTSIIHFFKMKKYFEDKENRYDVVIGSRAIKGAELDPPQPWYRSLPGKLGNIFIQIVLLPGIKDTQCGFKAFTSESATKIFKKSEIVGWGFDVEVLALAKKMGYKTKEIPVRWVNDLRSHVGASAYISVLIEVVKIRIRLITNKYKLR